MQCAVFILLLIEQITSFLSTSFCMVADDGVVLGRDARSTVVIVARKQVG
jgi:hypothetical protein